jgi:hypothetical protein
MENRTVNTVGADRVSTFPESSVPHHQGGPLGVEPGSAHDVGVVRQRTGGTRNRLGRLRERRAQFRLLSHCSP